MAVDGIVNDEMDAVAESGTIPASKHQTRPESVENERGDAGRDGRTCLAGSNSKSRKRGQAKIHFHPLFS